MSHVTCILSHVSFIIWHLTCVTCHVPCTMCDFTCVVSTAIELYCYIDRILHTFENPLVQAQAEHSVPQMMGRDRAQYPTRRSAKQTYSLGLTALCRLFPFSLGGWKAKKKGGWVEKQSACLIEATNWLVCTIEATTPQSMSPDSSGSHALSRQQNDQVSLSDSSG